VGAFNAGCHESDPMKYSLRSLMFLVLVLPPLLAWGGMPI